MEMRMAGKMRLAPVVSYTMFFWTILCFLGTWFIILRYGILRDGFIAMVVTHFFAAAIWGIPFVGLVLFYLSVSPSADEK